ncbi:MAG: hypothetical protein QOJ99_2157, partial [Bryobacterales bacterium]|nr:hypothetical protein [Bryobacterales bacterium]
EFHNLAGLFSDSHGPTQMLALQPRFGNARADTLAEDIVFEGRKHGEQTGHRPARRRRQVQCFGEGYERDAQFRQFLQGYDQIEE